MLKVNVGSWANKRYFDSQAYERIRSIISAGATLTDAHKAAINNFIVAEKIAGRWDSISRLYLPTWGVAAANAIDLKTGQSGAFNGGVTHATGYVQGNGTTGYLRDSLDLVEMGHTTTTGMYGALVTQSVSVAGAFAGIRDGVSDSIFDVNTTSINISLAGTGPSSGSYASAEQTGIFIGSRTGSSTFLRRRRAAGVTSVATASSAASAAPISGTNAEFCYLGRWNKGINTLQSPSDARVGCLFVGLGMDATNADAFTLNIKKLWEAVSGLTIA